MSHSTIKARRDCAGFTLIEVVVTMAVLSVVLVSIAALVGVSVRGVHAIADHMTLVETARAIETALGERGETKAGATSGQTGDERWRVDVRPFPTPASDNGAASPWQPVAETITVQAADGTTLSYTRLRLHRKQSQ